MVAYHDRLSPVKSQGSLIMTLRPLIIKANELTSFYMIGTLALNDLTVTAQKLKFSIKEFFSKCDQISSFHMKKKLKSFLSIFNSFHVVLLFSLKATQNRKYRKRLSDVAWINNKISLCRRSHRGDMKKVTWKYFSKHLYRSVFLIKFIKRC